MQFKRTLVGFNESPITNFMILTAEVIIISWPILDIRCQLSMGAEGLYSRIPPLINVRHFQMIKYNLSLCVGSVTSRIIGISPFDNSRLINESN